MDINGQRLATSDGAAISEESSVTMRAAEPTEVMLFDLA
jgi:redox-sensitive bicupin YhaK (pirin superfamily)